MGPTSPPAPYPLRPQNVVCTFRLGRRLNTVNVCQILHGRLQRHKFRAVICHSRIPTCTPSVFENGSHLIVGTSFVEDTRLAMYLLLHQYFTKLAIIPRVHNFRVRNIVCSASLGHFLDIHAFWLDHRTRSVYTPDSFEGCHFYFDRNPYKHKRSTVFVLFRSGRCVLTGATSKKQLETYFRIMLPTLRYYRRSTMPAAPTYGSTDDEVDQFKDTIKSLRMIGVPGPDIAGKGEDDDDNDDEEYEYVDEEDDDDDDDHDHDHDTRSSHAQSTDGAKRDRQTAAVQGHITRMRQRKSRLMASAHKLNRHKHTLEGVVLMGQAPSKRFKPTLSNYTTGDADDEVDYPSDEHGATDSEENEEVDYPSGGEDYDQLSL